MTKSCNKVKDLIEKNAIQGFSRQKKKLYYEHLKKRKSIQDKLDVKNKLNFKLKTFFKHPKYLKKKKDFERINGVVNKIKKSKSPMVRNAEKYYLQELMQEKSQKSKIRKMKEIDQKLQGYVLTETMFDESKEKEMSRVKSLDSMPQSSFNGKNLFPGRKSILNMSKIKKEQAESNTFLTSINETNDSGFIKEIVNEPKIKSSSKARKRYLDRLEGSLDKSPRFLDKISSQNEEITGSILDALNDSKLDKTPVCQTNRMPDIHKKVDFADFNDISRVHFNKSILKKSSKNNSKELKIPHSIKFAPVNPSKSQNFHALRPKRKSSLLRGNMSQLSLSLKYKLDELESSRAGFCPDLEMHNKRIHKTITKNKKRLLYLIKSCEDISSLEKSQTLSFKKTLVKDRQVMERANSKLKAKCEGSSPVVFYVPPNPERFKDYLKSKAQG